ncbi:MAG: HAMP domain-containing histidine kinase [Fibrobacterales bacterium]
MAFNNTIINERNKQLNYVLKIITVLTIVAVMVSFLRIFTTGWMPIMIIHAIAMFSFIVLYKFQHVFSYLFKAWTIISIGFVAAIADILTHGLLGTSLLLLITAAILAAVLIDYKVGLGIILFGSVLTLIVGWALANKIIPPMISYAVYIDSFTSWLLAAVSVVLFGITIIMVFERMHNILILKFETVDRQRLYLKEANSAKDMLYGVIAHDLKSPINGVIESLSYAKENREVFDRETLDTFNDALLINTTSIKLLLENLLNWCLLKKDNQKGEVTTFSSSLIVGDVINSFRLLIEHKGVVVQNDIRETETLSTDQRAVTIVLSNLLSNAIKFSQKGGGIEFTSSIKGDSTELSITDTGNGIDPEVIERIFKGSDNYTTYGTAGEKGTGIGLGLCKALMTEQGGDILVTSTPGKGSKFTLVFSDVKGFGE